jgi:hypothetical protein
MIDALKTYHAKTDIESAQTGDSCDPSTPDSYNEQCGPSLTQSCNADWTCSDTCTNDWECASQLCDMADGNSLGTCKTCTTDS